MSNNRRQMYLKTTGNCEAWLKLPLPLPPYITLSQFDYKTMERIEGLEFTEAMSMVKLDEKHLEFDMQTGQIIYGSIAGKCEKIAWYVDSSG